MAGLALPPLWEADPAAVDGRTVLVLGADRPLGTVARAHPELRTRFVVAYPPEDAYKTEEIRRDSRVELVAMRRLEFGSSSAPVTVEVRTVEGERRVLTADLAFLNLGGAPAPAGAVAADRSGYCPPWSQHPRVFTAGDLRSASSGSRPPWGRVARPRSVPTTPRAVCPRSQAGCPQRPAARPRTWAGRRTRQGVAEMR
ncbi:hypothetical protein SVIOM342S_06465 [Streptomyces violaceorubidus]